MKKSLFKISEMIENELSKVCHEPPGKEWQTREDIQKEIGRSEPQTDRILKKLLKQGKAEKKKFYNGAKTLVYYRVKRS